MSSTTFGSGRGSTYTSSSSALVICEKASQNSTVKVDEARAMIFFSASPFSVHLLASARGTSTVSENGLPGIERPASVIAML